MFFNLRSQYTAKEPEESRRGTGANEQKGSFSEVRRKLSRKTGKKGGEIWPPSQISSGHGGEVLQEFARSALFSCLSALLPATEETRTLLFVCPRPPPALLRLFGVAFSPPHYFVRIRIDPSFAVIAMFLSAPLFSLKSFSLVFLPFKLISPYFIMRSKL